MERASLKKSFRTLLDTCLEMQNRQEILVIYDETFLEFFPALLEVVLERRLGANFSYVPRRYQFDLIQRGETGVELPDVLIGSFDGASAILNVLSADLSTASFRRAVILQPRPKDCRFAHIPGISAEILRMLNNSPIDVIHESCELIAWALGEADDVKLTSFDCEGKPYELTLKLGGWNNEPLMSTGVIPPGSWGNIPPGETFCCPRRRSVNGEVCITGSITGKVLRRGHEVVLRFENDELVDWQASAQSPAGAFFDQLRRDAKMRGDENWNQFAELGIGLNPAITDLTGTSLFDEKVLGTMHVAIGDNTCFGHDVKSDIHADLVTWHPTLSLDGRVIAERGKLCLEALRSQRRASPQNDDWSSPDPGSTVSLRKAKYHLDQNRFARRMKKAGRVSYVTIAEGTLSRALSALVTHLETGGAIEVATLLQSSPKFSGHPTAQLLGILHHYQIIRVASPIPVGLTA